VHHARAWTTGHAAARQRMENAASCCSISTTRTGRGSSRPGRCCSVGSPAGWQEKTGPRTRRSTNWSEMRASPSTGSGATGTGSWRRGAPATSPSSSSSGAHRSSASPRPTASRSRWPRSSSWPWVTAPGSAWPSRCSPQPPTKESIRPTPTSSTRGWSASTTGRRRNATGYCPTLRSRGRRPDAACHRSPCQPRTTWPHRGKRHRSSRCSGTSPTMSAQGGS
jgi:hypothetical protein